MTTRCYQTIKGKMSTFGGPRDTGMRPTEGLALWMPHDHPPDGLFLPGKQVGFGRTLNPLAFYVAARWQYRITPKEWLKRIKVRVTNPKTGVGFDAIPADWGPAAWTGRAVDISPGLAEKLGLKTDDECEVLVPLPKGKG